MDNPRILIFSAKFGNGHLRAAQALVESVYEAYPHAEIVHLDAIEMLNKRFNAVLKDFYLGMIKRTPRLWGGFYYGIAAISPDSGLQRLLNTVGKNKYMKYINLLQPDLIICTYPTVAGVLSELRMKHILDIPVATVITDYAIHNQWVHPGIDLYIVGCEDVRRGLESRGIDREKIKVTGIPVSACFEKELDRAELMGKMGLKPHLPVVLLMGGAYGILDIKGVCKMLADTTYPCQTLVVCGRDDKLYASLDINVWQGGNTVLKFGFVDNVEEFMTMADLIITKAGGLTVTEALTKGVPMLIYKPIPGQEEQNTDFLARNGAAIAVHNRSELERQLHELLTDPARLEEMKKAAGSVLPGRSAWQAVHYMLDWAEANRVVAKVG
ncbi:MAG TPA: glycosyltransferase, partial [Syntrophomonas sp.]|nr:glycosyltransferase [Syntrophomonas sp.]